MLESAAFSVNRLGSEHQRRGAVDAAGELLVDHVEPSRVGAEQLQLRDEVGGVLLLLALLLHEPVKELHRAEIIGFLRGGYLLFLH